jgi:hypothetical protein
VISPAVTGSQRPMGAVCCLRTSFRLQRCRVWSIRITRHQAKLASFLHTGGLCDTITDTSATTPDRRLEARCNAIAAEILMPESAVLAQPEVRAHEHDRDGWDYSSLAAAAPPFGVSAEAFLRRLLALGRVDTVFYRRKVPLPPLGCR